MDTKDKTDLQNALLLISAVLERAELKPTPQFFQTSGKIIYFPTLKTAPPTVAPRVNV